MVLVCCHLADGDGLCGHSEPQPSSGRAIVGSRTRSDGPRAGCTCPGPAPCPTGSRPDLYDLAKNTLTGGNPRKPALKYVEDHLDLKGNDAVEYLRKRNLKVNNPHEDQLVVTGQAILAPASDNDYPFMTPRDYLSFLRSVENNISATKEANNKSGLLEQLREMDSRIDWDPEGLSNDTFAVKALQQELVQLIENFEASTSQEEQKADTVDDDGKPALA